MGNERLLLCTDMDRTVIPNGAQPEDPKARKLFFSFCSLPEVTLVYVTGRHQELVQEAIREYSLPEPNFVITDVGSKIYKTQNGQWEPLKSWEEKIDRDWKGKNRTALKEMFTDIPVLELQEESKQNTHKLSYYLSLQADKDEVLTIMKQRLIEGDVLANLIWSIDEPRGIGLLDVLPQSASKLTSIMFLQQLLQFEHRNVLFAGDSGNDVPVLESKVHSVLVANAADDVRDDAHRLARLQGNSNTLYCANGDHLGMNGNYSAGILEGVWHFIPAFRDKLQQLI